MNILRNKNFNVFLIYLGLIATIYAQVVFFGKSLLPYLYHPIEKFGLYNCADRKPINTFHVDLAAPAFESAPINNLVGNMYLKGELPLWNPYQGCGTPLAAQYSTRVFFPYQILENISPWWMQDYFMLGRLVIAGFFTYLFLTTFGLSPLTSFLGGIFYMFSGSMVWFINYEPFVNVAMTVPILLFCLEKMLKHQNNFSLFLSSIAITLVLLAGQPEIAIYVLLLAAIYYFFRILINRELRLLFLKNILKFVLILLLGMGLAAILILPFLELIPNSYNCHPPGGKSGVRSPALLGYFINFFMPSFSELPTYYRNLPHNGIWDYLGGYSGVTALYLLFLGMFYKKNQYYKYHLFFGIFGLMIILKNFNFPLISWLGRLPLLDQSWSPRWAGPVWTFSFACAGAIGLEIISSEAQKKKLICWLVALGILSLILLYYPLAPFWFKPEEFGRMLGLTLQEFNKILPLFLLGTIVASYVLFTVAFLITNYRHKKNLLLSIIFLSILELWFCIPKGMDFNWRTLELIPFIIGIFSVFTLINEKWVLSVIGIIIAVIFAIFIDIRSPHGFPKRCNVFVEKPYIKFLQYQKGYYRIVGAEGILIPNFAGAFGIFDVRYIDALSPASYQNYADNYLLKFPNVSDTDRLWFTGIPDGKRGMEASIYRSIVDNLVFYSFLGVKYILTPSSASLNLPLAYNREIKIYENPFCLPRIFITHEIEYASSYTEAQKRIGSSDFNLRNRVVLEEKVPQRYNKLDLIDNSQASIEEYQPTYVVIKAYLENPGVLVLTDIFYPGWEAYVDNRKIKIYRVNGLVRGLLLEKGNHIIIFKYFPHSFKIGLGIGGICLILCIVLVCRESRKTKQIVN